MTATHEATGPVRRPANILVVAARILRGAARRPQQFGMSYPKSGRTWLRAMMGHVLCGRTGLSHAQLLNTRRLTAAAGLPVLKWHHGGGTLKAHGDRHDTLSFDHRMFDGRNVLFMIRDPRDTLVSAFFQASRRIGSFAGDIATFVRSSERGIHKWIAYHNMWHENVRCLGAFRVVTYESLHAEPVPVLRNALAAIGLEDATDAELQAAVEFARFDNLKRIEAGARVSGGQLRPRDESDPDSFKVRKGRVGGYKQALAADDIAFIEEALAATPCPLYQAHYPAG